MKNLIRWLLFIVSFLMVLSGYGLSNSKIIETITFGLLSKKMSFQLHSFLSLPFIILFLLHVSLAFVSGRKK